MANGRKSFYTPMIVRRIILFLLPLIVLSAICKITGSNIVYSISLIVFFLIQIFTVRNIRVATGNWKRYFTVNGVAFAVFLLFGICALLLINIIPAISYISSMTLSLKFIFEKAVVISNSEALILFYCAVALAILIAPLGLKSTVELINIRRQNDTDVMEGGSPWSYAEGFKNLNNKSQNQEDDEK